MDSQFISWLIGQGGIVFVTALAAYLLNSAWRAYDQDHRALMEHMQDGRRRDIEFMREAKTAPKPKRCAYCGTKVDGDACASCGAPVG